MPDTRDKIDTIGVIIKSPYGMFSGNLLAQLRTLQAVAKADGMRFKFVMNGELLDDLPTPEAVCPTTFN